MEQDRHITKCSTPHDHRRVEVRMRNGDRNDPATALDLGDGGFIYEPDEISENIPVRCFDQVGLLTDSKARFGRNPGDSRLHRVEAIVMRSN
jgi:hypothetical protein